MFGLETFKILSDGMNNEIFTSEICNNHQLGNFWCLPLEKYQGSTLNTMKNSKCTDYMDLAIKQFKDYLNEKTMNDFGLILSQASYYTDHFDDFDSFIEKNYLSDYIKQEEIVNLSELTFEEYVVIVNRLVELRGRTMFRKLMSELK